MMSKLLLGAIEGRAGKCIPCGPESTLQADIPPICHWKDSPTHRSVTTSKLLNKKKNGGALAVQRYPFNGHVKSLNSFGQRAKKGGTKEDHSASRFQANEKSSLLVPSPLSAFMQ